jgi:phytol kinase
VTRAAGAEGARKALHLCTAAVPVALAMGRLSPEDARTGAVVVVVTAALLEIGRARIPAVRAAIERVAGPLFREGERHAISGATWLAVAIAFALFALPFRAAVAATWAASVGDATAALVGRAFTRGAPPPTGTKTIAGSLACATSTAVGVWWFATAEPAHALIIGAAAALAERLRVQVDDNVRVTAAAGLAAWALGVE